MVALALCIASVVVIWPRTGFSEAPRPDPAPVVPGPDAAPGVPGLDPLWEVIDSVPPGVDRVVGVGPALLAVTPGAIWPVSVFRAGVWDGLSGLPVGFDPIRAVGVRRQSMLTIVGAVGARGLLFDFTFDGAFRGTRTLPGVVPGAAVALDETVFVFDAREPVMAEVGATVTKRRLPGVVVDAATTGSDLVVVLDDGSAHASSDAGRTWHEVGSGLVALAATDHAVVGVGATASAGLARYEPGTGFVRLDHAPFGPIVAWGDGVGVHDWSTDSVWLFDGLGGGWERLPLWEVRGFTGRLERMVDGSPHPRVVSRVEDGSRLLWRWEG